ncbi:acyl transferase/acyl hydrolase/lysophospholipase [Pyronema omphalodes]|nr:acyl transferase/acyl hydrolase/lysophospholipase [Pyronema omphalodes]
MRMHKDWGSRNENNSAISTLRSIRLYTKETQRLLGYHSYQTKHHTKMAEKNNIYTKRPLMVMILNGGGIRGYASLCILEEVEKKCKEFLGSEYTDEFKPCTVFNVIGGVSTGAIIAIMLGRLEMTIAECKREYERFSEIIFGDTKIKTYLRLAFTLIHRKNHILPYLYKADGLEQAIDKCLQERGFGVDEPLSPAEDAEIGNQCTVMVPVIDVGTLREYRKLQGVNRVLCTHTNDGSSQAWTIKQAIMAATSAPIYFPSPYEHPGTKLNFLDAATTGNSNPSVLIYSRIKKVVGHRKEALLLDIGTGRSDHPEY